MSSDDDSDYDDFPDTVDPSDSEKEVHPLLRRKRRLYTSAELQELGKLRLDTIPEDLIPIDTRRRVWQPPVMFYGWEVKADAMLKFAQDHGFETKEASSCQRSELTGHEDPLDLSDDPEHPERVYVRRTSLNRAILEVICYYVEELNINSCAGYPIRIVLSPKFTTQILAFYSNYSFDDAPCKGELEALSWAMDEFGMGGELRWWVCAREAHWRDPGAEWPKLF